MYKKNDQNKGSYLCPNNLSFGRARNRVPAGNLVEDNNYRQRWKFVQQVA